MYTGDILRSMRLTIKATCPLDLQYFPLDTQMCTLEIESFGYTMSDLKFRYVFDIYYNNYCYSYSLLKVQKFQNEI